MRKRKLPIYNYDWFSYPPEWDEQSRRLCQQDAIKPSTTTLETKISSSIANIGAKEEEKR